MEGKSRINGKLKQTSTNTKTSTSIGTGPIKGGEKKGMRTGSVQTQKTESKGKAAKTKEQAESVAPAAKEFTTREAEQKPKASPRLAEAFEYYQANFPGKKKSLEEISAFPQAQQQAFIDKIETKKLILAYAEYVDLYGADAENIDLSKFAALPFKDKHKAKQAYLAMLNGQIKAKRLLIHLGEQKEALKKQMEELKQAFHYYESLSYNTPGTKLTFEEIQNATLEKQQSFLKDVEDLRLKDAFEKYRDLNKLPQDAAVKQWETIEEMLSASESERLAFLQEVEDLEFEDAYNRSINLKLSNLDPGTYEELLSQMTSKDKRLFIGVVKALEHTRELEKAKQPQGWGEWALSLVSRGVGGLAAIPKTYIESTFEKVYGRPLSSIDWEEVFEFGVMLSPEKQMEFLERKQVTGEWLMISSMATLLKGFKDRTVETYEQGKASLWETFGPSAMTKSFFGYMFTNTVSSAKENIGKNISEIMGILDVPIKLIGDKLLGSIQSHDVAKEGYFLARSFFTTEDNFTQEQLDRINEEGDKFSAEHQYVRDYILSLKMSDRVATDLTNYMATNLMTISSSVIWSQIQKLAPKELLELQGLGENILSSLLKGQAHIYLMESGLSSYLYGLLPAAEEIGNIPVPGISLTPTQISIAIFTLISTAKMLEKIYFTTQSLTQEEIKNQSADIVQQAGMKFLMKGGPFSLKELGVSKFAKECSNAIFNQITSIEPSLADLVFISLIFKKFLKAPAKKILGATLKVGADFVKSSILSANPVPEPKPVDQQKPATGPAK